jgi:hypothetical protein
MQTLCKGCEVWLTDRIQALFSKKRECNAVYRKRIEMKNELVEIYVCDILSKLYLIEPEHSGAVIPYIKQVELDIIEEKNECSDTIF